MSSQRFICFPIWLVVSSFSAGSNSFVPPRDTSLVSQSGWWCPALWLSPIHLFPACGNSFVSQSGWWCPAFYAVCCLQFICLPLWQLICLPVWLVVSGSSAVSVTLVMSGSLAVSNSFVSKSGWWRLCLPNDSFVSQSGWWCPAFRLAPIHLSPLVTLHLSPSLAGGVRLSGCLQFMCLPLWQSICLPVWLVVFGSLRVSIPVWLVVSGLGYVQVICFPLVAIHLSPSLAGGVRLFACLDPTRLVVSGSSTVSNSFVSPCSNAFVSQSG